MTKNDTKILIAINDRIIAEDIQRILEEANIFTLLTSDNPASSVMNAFMGSNPSETITVHVSVIDYQNAVDILSDGTYQELIYKE